MDMKRERSQSPPVARSSFRKRATTSDAGFSLVEVMVSTVILTVGLTAMAQLLAISVRMHSDAREASLSTQLAQTQLDTLVKLDFTAPQIQITGADTLNANTANYFDTPQPAVTRRWNVIAGPAANTRLLTVRVINRRARQYGAQVDISTIIRQW
jgi:prepilin-type N-terminal cleavage/methylation domain-containing protein